VPVTALIPGKTFLLGVGCQKGGTTWLHDYLAGSPQVDPGFLKEYHLFDVLDLPGGAQFRELATAKARKALRLLDQGEPADAGPLRRAAFYADPELYFEYFAGLLAHDGVRLTADITPAYAALSGARFAAIRAAFADRGIAVKVVFLLRDPVERIWSAERMFHRLHPEQAVEPVEDRVLRTFDNPFHEERTRYQVTMAALEQAFDPDQIHYGFYETLFAPESLRGLCEFLGIDFVEPDLERRLNSSPKAIDLSEPTVRRIATHYGDVYAAMATRFGERAISDLWPGARYAMT
jgi:hypothetical protein